MATEKRMIDANVVEDAFTKWLTSTYDGRMPSDVVAEIPTVDAVEVVRCKDCRYRYTKYSCQGRSLEWYCPNGERIREKNAE